MMLGALCGNLGVLYPKDGRKLLHPEISLKCDPGHLHRSKGIKKAHGKVVVFPKTSEGKATCSEIPAQVDWGLLDSEMLVIREHPAH